MNTFLSISTIVFLLFSTVYGIKLVEKPQQLISSVYNGEETPYAPATNEMHSSNNNYWDTDELNGLSVQSGWEGLLIPDDVESTFQKTGTALGLLGSLLTPFPKLGLKLILKFGFIAFSFLSLLAIGGLLTSAVCTLTPLCTISFLGLRFNQDSVRGFVNEDRLARFSKFLNQAIEKYSKLQKNIKKTKKVKAR